MNIPQVLPILFYLLSTTAYFVYLFRQKDTFHKTGFTLLIIGFLFQTLVIGMKFMETGVVPVRNLHETLSLAGWTVALAFIAVHMKYGLKILGIFAAPLAALAVVASTKFPVEPHQVNAAFRSVWVAAHVIVIFIGEASFALAFGAGCLYLLQERAIKAKNRGFFYSRLPSLELLDRIGYACLITGFTLMTVGLIAGFVYAKAIWGKFWSGDPKEAFSLATWLIYAVLLHERLTVGWRGRKAAIWAIIGFGFLLFTFFGVNFLFRGHHMEFTRW